MQEKQRCMILFFQFFNHFLCWVRFLLLSKYLLWEKNCYYPLNTTQGYLFASCENISCAQISSLPPYPPVFRFPSIQSSSYRGSAVLAYFENFTAKTVHVYKTSVDVSNEKNNPNRNSRAIFSKVITQSDFDFALSSEGKDFAS